MKVSKKAGYTLTEVLIFIIWVVVIVALIVGAIVAWHFISKFW